MYSFFISVFVIQATILQASASHEKKGSNTKLDDQVDFGFIINHPSFQLLLQSQVNKLLNSKINSLCKNATNDSHPDLSCLRGPPGPQGPRGRDGAMGPRMQMMENDEGPRGERGPKGDSGSTGLTLFEPILVDLTKRVEVNISDSANITCRFSGNPLPKLSWSIQAKNISYKIFVNREKGEIASTAYIQNITRNDHGFFKCLASNSVGETSAIGRLLVHSKPIIRNHSRIFYAGIGEPFAFPPCNASGYPKPNITWSRVYQKINYYRARVVNNTVNFTRVVVEDEGYYICTAKNYLGSNQSMFQLKTSPLRFARKPPYYQVFDRVRYMDFECAAYGNPYEMKGYWVNIFSGRIMYSWNKYSGNLYRQIMRTERPGYYECRITSGGTTISSRTIVKEFSSGSCMLRKSEEAQLYQWIRSEIKQNASSDFKSCWKMENNTKLLEREYNNQTYKSMCNLRKPNIMIMKDIYGHVFGGYKGINGTAFLFDFTKNLKFEKWGNVKEETCVKTKAKAYGRFGPCFYDALYPELKYDGSKGRYFSLYAKSSLNGTFAKYGYSHLGSSGDVKLKSFEILHATL